MSLHSISIVIPSEVEGSHEVAQFLTAFCAAFNFTIHRAPRLCAFL
jgi:hypothetical protein